mgnify:CR=1 FL=1
MAYVEGRIIHDADSHLMELDDCLDGFFTPSLLPRFRGGAARSRAVAARGYFRRLEIRARPHPTRVTR